MSNYNNRFKNNKDDCDEYTPKTHPKKQKQKNTIFDIQMPEYMAIKEDNRRKRENDKKYKNKRYR